MLSPSPSNPPPPTSPAILDVCLKHVWSQSVPGGDNILTESFLGLMGTINNKGGWFLRSDAGGHSSKPKPRRLFPPPRAIAELINQKGGQAGLSGIRGTPAWS